MTMPTGEGDGNGFMYTQTCEGGVQHELSHADGEALVCASLCKFTGVCIANRMRLDNVEPQDPEAHLYEQHDTGGK